MTLAFVTGGSSPLGERLLPVLLAEGIDVIALVRSDESARAVGASGASVLRGDLHDPSPWAASANQSDAVIHLAGIRFAPALITALPGPKQVIAISSASVANPHHPLFADLTAHEQALRAAFVSLTILRPTMIYGTARDRNVRYLAKALTRLPRVPHFRGGHRIQPVHVDDVVAAVKHQLLAPRYDTLAVGGPDQIQLDDLVDIIATQLCLVRTSLHLPLSALSRALSLTRLGKTNRALHAIEMFAHDRTVSLPDPALLGRDPIPLVLGMRNALETYGLLLSQTP
jgi:uncharacterized protein YbjT (DUF2867 family)